MKFFLTDKAKVTCKHLTGVVQLFTFQNLVTIEGDPVLVDNDPEMKLIVGCSNVSPTIKPCSLTLKATEGYSDFVFIAGRRVTLDTIRGLTDGTVPGTIDYIERDPGQHFVVEVS
jgi:hypothetical protein